VTFFSDDCDDVTWAEASGALVGDCENDRAELAVSTWIFAGCASALPKTGGAPCRVSKRKTVSARDFILAPNGLAARLLGQTQTAIMTWLLKACKAGSAAAAHLPRPSRRVIAIFRRQSRKLVNL